MEPQQQGVSVRLLLFSGRPDPEWTLDDAAIAALRERVRRTVGTETTSLQEPGALGYRGFLVRNMAGVAGLPAMFAVFRRVLSEPPGPRANHWRDIGDVENLLLGQARERGFGKALEAVGVEAEPPRPR